MTDAGSGLVRRLTVRPDGVSYNATTIGSGFSNHYGIAVHPTSGAVFVADTFNNVIKQIMPPTWTITTIAGSGTSGSVDGTGTAARFNYPMGLAVDPTGNVLYTCDSSSNTVRKIEFSSGQWAVSTIAGLAGATGALTDGVGSAARFSYPNAVAVGPDGATLYVTDANNGVVRRIAYDGSTYTVSTIAGSLSAKPQCFDQYTTPVTVWVRGPNGGIALDPANGNRITVFDSQCYSFKALAVPPPSPPPPLPPLSPRCGLLKQHR